MSGLKEIIFEFRRVGNFVRVSAVDPVTYTEVQIMGPVGAGQEGLKRVAAQKLRYVLSRQQDKKSPRNGFVV